jgi:ketosteroid isomerase-like protein
MSDSADPVAVVTAFNEAINVSDLDVLAALMTDTHRFVDAAGAAVDGKAACVEAWRGFFATFPDYRNVFAELTPTGDGVVELTGRSTCSDPALDGPGRWRAVVRDGRVDVWQVQV